MAAKNNDYDEYIEYPETITIIAEPSFGSAMKFLVVGAALGAAATLYLRKNGEAVTEAPAAKLPDAVRKEQLNNRIQALAAGVKNVAGKAGSAAKLASKAVTPAIKNAVEEGKRVARATIDEIDDDLETEPDIKYASEGERIEAEKAAEAKKLGLDHFDKK